LSKQKAIPCRDIIAPRISPAVPLAIVDQLPDSVLARQAKCSWRICDMRLLSSPSLRIGHVIGIPALLVLAFETGLKAQFIGEIKWMEYIVDLLRLFPWTFCIHMIRNIHE
jgi:hypothetical protein